MDKIIALQGLGVGCKIFIDGGGGGKRREECLGGSLVEGVYENLTVLLGGSDVEGAGGSGIFSGVRWVVMDIY